MVKRATAITFLALASILLLAHAVVPHHHHNHQVCFINSHCNHEDLTDKHGTNQDGHSHDGEKNDHENCALREPIVVFSNQWKSDLIVNISTDRSDLDDFHYNSLKSSPEFQIPILLNFLYERAINGSYSSLVSSSMGLRAPPVV